MNNDYGEYWEKCWNEENSEELFNYLDGYFEMKSPEIDIFKENNIKNICDAASGFGAYSLALASNGFNVHSFDISETAVKMTINALKKYGMDAEKVMTASILDTGYEDESFDGVVAHAVLDHLTVSDSKKALIELFRITRKNGLIWISFDMVEEDDLKEPHVLLKDGTMKYTCGSRAGLLYHPYDWAGINTLLKDYRIVYKADKGERERSVILRKE
ncbi:MAG: class I SAM-dependent methyltransferase [Ruminococcaceae bacterium]|nr:class I SAM-dependent methyltransferase [Oscillospiraceae bacterium]